MSRMETAEQWAERLAHAAEAVARGKALVDARREVAVEATEKMVCAVRVLAEDEARLKSLQDEDALRRAIEEVKRATAESAARRAGKAECVFGLDVAEAIEASVVMRARVVPINTYASFAHAAAAYADYVETIDTTTSRLIDGQVEFLRIAGGAPAAAAAAAATDASGDSDAA